MQRFKKGLNVIVASAALSFMSGSSSSAVVEPEHLTSPDTEVILPVFSLPEQLDCMKNHIEAVFVSRHDDREEISVVFSDESHPNRIIDWLYHGFRHLRYGRTKDIETFVFRYQDKTNIPDSIEFPGSYSDGQRWNHFFQHHYERVLSMSDFTMSAARPVLYINTWNHLFSNKNTNDDDANPPRMTTISNYPVYRGSRQDAERWFRYRHDVE